MMASRQQMADEASQIVVDNIEVELYEETDEETTYKARDDFGTEGYFDVDADGNVEAGRVTRPSRHPTWLRKARAAVSNEHRRRRQEGQGYAYVISFDGDEFLEYDDEFAQGLDGEDGIEVTLIFWE